MRAEEHDLHAFVRFRPVRAANGEEEWLSWYRPQHRVVARVAPFFARRYPNMCWTLFTPEQSAHWDTRTLSFGPGISRDREPENDELDRLFLTYYQSVFNPARNNPELLQKHLPRHVMTQLPEARIVSGLIRQAAPRVESMSVARSSASQAYIPERGDLATLRGAASACRACPIGERATQAVFGEGPGEARFMIVGEQPGDEEDQIGRPFVGPAGRLLDELMREAGLTRSRVYVTNAVKHFKWEARGKRRLHSKPNQDEIRACSGWLLAELKAVRPAMILCLGATAGQSLLGSTFRVQRDRGKPMSTPWAPWFMATYHPSALLRAPDEPTRSTMRAQMLDDLARTAAQLHEVDHDAGQPPSNERS